MISYFQVCKRSNLLREIKMSILQSSFCVTTSIKKKSLCCNCQSRDKTFLPDKYKPLVTLLLIKLSYVIRLPVVQVYTSLANIKEKLN